MEFVSQTSESNCDFAFDTAVSWPVLHGSLKDSVNCESSFTPDHSDGISAIPKPVLVLRRPSIDCGPCEIKISFEQKHEIRQVYVRSTARVYEIYYAADKQSMNEYLYTVRCGIAAKTEECLANESLQNMGAATSFSPSSVGSNKLSEGLRTYSGSNTNEDGWVEIKDTDSSLAEDGVFKTAVHVERDNQDFYQAAVEISDANPCTSLTIRLLSLQNAESVYIDEIYVFADPVECDDVNSTSKEVEGSAANPLMSMLIPTLMQLSKSRTNHISDLNSYSKKAESQDKKSSSGSNSTCAKIQKEEIQSVSIEQGTVSSKLECPDQSKSWKATTENVNDHIGKTLDQLVSRMARIEQFCLSFEQRMITPITRMDARIGEVEQQLKLLNEKFQLPEMHSSTGNYAPDIPRNGSEFSSFHTDDSTTPNYKDESSIPFVITAPEFSNSSLSLENDACSTEGVAKPVPGLAVTAPEFSCGEEEEEENGDDSVSVGGFPNEKLKKPLSIDDALADALAGFVSSTINQDITITNGDYDSDKDGAKIVASQLVESDEHDGTTETSIDTVPEIREHDPKLFGSCSEPVGHTFDEENAENLFVDDAENEFAQAEETGTKEDDTGNDETPWKMNSSSGEMLMTEDSLNAIFDLPIQAFVDYKIPILDVKFESRDSCNLSSSIEALLTETPEANIEISNGIIAFEDDSVEPDNSEAILLEASEHLLVDLGQDYSTYESHSNSKEVSVPLF